MGKKYQVLVVDPPWGYRKTGKRRVRPNQGPDFGYPTMSKEEIANVPIREWADDQCFLWLWATNGKDRATGEPVLRMAFDLLDAWGFKFYTMVTWNKKTGPCPFGPYQIITEHVLFAYKGKGFFDKGCLGKLQTCFTEASKGHSVKPDSFYRSIVDYFPGNRLDVFARQVRDGFDGWGDEYEGLSGP
jgi:N6-adenosine-specific RNA methylase IME4